MAHNTLIIDTECYRNFFYIGVKRVEDGRRVGYEFSPRADFDRDRVRYFMKRNLTVGFNSIGYDLPMIYLALEGASNSELKDASDRIIKDRVPWWEVERALDIHIPKLDHIDLIETNPSVKDSLKALNGRMHGKRMQDLPIDPDKVLTEREMDITADYCLHSDLDATHTLFDYLQEPLHLREAMGERYGQDFRSKSDAQMGERIIKSEVEKKRDTRVYKAKVKEGTTFRYQVPDWMHFEEPMMQEVLETIRNTDIVIGKGGKVQFPKAFEKFKIGWGDTSYKLGIGGLHSQEAKRHLRSDNQHILIDADVASQYPSIIMKLGLYPEALGRDFLPVYRELMERRLAAKKAKDKVTDKGLKISINGAYGKLGSAYSVLFAPHLMIAVTLTGQLSLLMLIERAEKAGIHVVSGNTDGVIFQCPRDMWDGFELYDDGSPSDRLRPSPIQDIIDWWEGITGFKLEFNEYAEIYNQSVNSYMALKPDGGFKRKGPLANHWTDTLPWGDKNTDFDPTRSGLMKNPQMTIIADAVLGFIRNGIPIEETIYGCKDPRQFVTVIKATGGATWTDPDGESEEEYLGKVVRFYWSTSGAPLVKVKAHPTTGNRPKVPKTDGARPMMNLPDDLPTDIDYERYIAAAWKMLEDMGWKDDQPSLPPLAFLINKLLNGVEGIGE